MILSFILMQQFEFDIPDQTKHLPKPAAQPKPFIAFGKQSSNKNQTLSKHDQEKRDLNIQQYREITGKSATDLSRGAKTFLNNPHHIEQVIRRANQQLLKFEPELKPEPKVFKPVPPRPATAKANQKPKEVKQVKPQYDQLMLVGNAVAVTEQENMQTTNKLKQPTSSVAAIKYFKDHQSRKYQKLVDQGRVKPVILENQARPQTAKARAQLPLNISNRPATAAAGSLRQNHRLHNSMYPDQQTFQQSSLLEKKRAETKNELSKILSQHLGKEETLKILMNAQRQKEALQEQMDKATLEMKELNNQFIGTRQSVRLLECYKAVDDFRAKDFEQDLARQEYRKQRERERKIKEQEDEYY